VAVTLIGEAVFARCLSSIKDERVAASAVLPAGVMTDTRHLTEIANRVEDLRRAVYAAKIVSYAQGFHLLRAASDENNWKINFGSCALMWRGEHCAFLFLGLNPFAFKVAVSFEASFSARLRRHLSAILVCPISCWTGFSSSNSLLVCPDGVALSLSLQNEEFPRRRFLLLSPGMTDIAAPTAAHP
jgi:hypothetical protein